MSLDADKVTIPDEQGKSGIRDELGRFKEGVSGNPKGRPRVSLMEEIRRQLKANPVLLS
jgi:hypothetical protein